MLSRYFTDEFKSLPLKEKMEVIHNRIDEIEDEIDTLLKEHRELGNLSYRLLEEQGILIANKMKER